MPFLSSPFVSGPPVVGQHVDGPPGVGPPGVGQHVVGQHGVGQHGVGQHVAGLHRGEAREASDDALVDRCHLGEEDALNLLLERYRRFARAKARGYFIAGGDLDDLEQEGMIGLFKAVRDYRPDREASFRGFAELCITRQIMTAIKTATRQKHRPLNQYVSLWGLRMVDDPGECLVDELPHHQVPDPADELVSSEDLADMQASLARMLSELEVDVLHLYVEGRSYQEIGEQLGRHVKSIDNALQRIKRKLEGHLASRAPDRCGGDGLAAATSPALA